MSFLKTIETIIRGKELPPLPNKPIFGYNHKPQPLRFNQQVSFDEVTKEIEGASSASEPEEEKKTDDGPNLIEELDRNYWLLHLRTTHERDITPRDAVTMLPSEYYGDAEIMLEFIRLEPQGILVATSALKNSHEFMKAAYRIAPVIIAMLDGREDISPEMMAFLIQEEEIDTLAKNVRWTIPTVPVSDALSTSTSLSH
ncbi:hypothetical protein [Paraburkholderia aromaticivorans]|uniref:hypothetical protein n=1 Tax=Paraburkholderia aromaticivorans TaxID=2026199 RepID=UPI0038BCB784